MENKKHPTPQTIARKVRKLFKEAELSITSTDYSEEGSWFYGENKSFNMRAFVRNVPYEELELEIHLGFKRTFDRWANSRNFQINIWWWNIPKYVDIKTALKQANAIVKHSGINFNQYFHTIQLDV